jgi:nucleotidyltransferase/DNA polymerase involved in DNA repair
MGNLLIVYQAKTDPNHASTEGLSSCGKKTKAELIEYFGNKHGESMYRYARGVDNAPLETDREAKSIGSETTFDKDTLDAPTILAIFKQLIDEVSRQVKKDKKVLII